MPGFTLFSGNRLELLAEHLAISIGEAPLSPLTKEIIIVQNPGIGQWLTGILAERHGICANFRFPLPNLFIREILTLVTSGKPSPSGFHREELIWHIMALLPDLSAQDIGHPLRAYLATDNSRKIYHLARSLAAIFDRYTVFRPEMLLSWDQGKTITKDPGELWQASLWMEITKRISPAAPDDTHHGALLQAARERLVSQGSPLPGLPSRLALFGISSLPPAHLDILAGLARHCDITLYLLNPCREYWEDIVSDRDISRLRKKSPGKSTEAELFLTRGNPILASLGRLNRDFLASCRSYDPEEEDFFAEPSGRTLLALVQRDILELVDRSDLPDAEAEPLTIGTDDDSVQIHVCHSRLREVEVLHDHILHLLNDTSDLSPRDIWICSPDLTEYVPLVRAVFDSAAPDAAVPYTIAAPTLKKGSLTETFFAILELAESRITAAQVLKIMESPSVRRSFGFSEIDSSRIRHMIENAGIRWGMDSEDRQHHGLPPFAENSWRAGLDRLLLGYAMTGNHGALFKEILPADTGPGESSELLGSLLECLSVLFGCVQAIRIPCPMEEWAKRLLDTLDRCLIADKEEEGEYLLLRRGISELMQHTRRASFTGDLDAAVVRDHLRQTLEQDRHGSGAGGHLSGGVHFTEMTAMRSIPCRIICVIGMNDQDFPRPTQEVNFDLMAAHPRPGDRSARLDDRALFLEILVSAREQLYISYIGRSPVDDSHLPPSVLVSDLLDVIDRGYRTATARRDIVKQLRTEHRLQPFHHAYFQGNKGEVAPSFSRENYHAAQTLSHEKTPPPSFFNSPLPQPPDSLREISIDALGNFFLNPVRSLCATRLNIRIPARPEIPAEDESFVITGLDRYKLENEILRHHRAGYGPEALFQAKKAAGDLPVGRIGKSLFQQTWTDVTNLEKRLESLDPGPSLPPLPVRLDLPPFTITGAIDSAHGQGRSRGLVQLRCATVKAKDRIRAWLLHLIHGVFCKSANKEAGQTLLLGKDKTFLLQPVDNAEEELVKLLSLYWQGMSSPLPFFAETSFTFAQNRLQKKSEQESLNRARSIWNGSMHRTGECEDPYYRLSHRQRDPLNEEFMEVAEAFYIPLLAHQEQVS